MLFSRTIEFICILFIIHVIIVGHISCSKYTIDANPNEKDERPFRMLKSNQLWDKAMRKFGDFPNKMAELYADLKIHDKQLGSLKKLKTEGLDQDGLKEAALEKKFVELMAKHGLISDTGKRYHDELDNETSYKSTEFTDKKLNRLWKKAKQAGFTDEELELLKEEFVHQQTKLDEYYELKNDVDHFYDMQKKSVEPYTDGTLDAESVKQHENTLKQSQRGLKENYRRLAGLSLGVKDTESDFRDTRVHELWALALAANMTKTELASFKEELKHFDNRIEKHEYFEQQRELSEKRLDLGEKDVVPDQHLHLEKKAIDYKHKVKKLHNGLKKKINEAIERHTEL